MRRLLFLSPLLLLSSCFKQPTQSVVADRSAAASSGAVVHEYSYSDSAATEESSTSLSWGELIDGVERGQEYKDLEREFNKIGEVYFSNDFTEKDSQYVTNRSHDPFGDNSYFVLPLAEMKDGFCYPIKGKFLSNFGMRSGRMHSGVDIKAAPRDTIRAAFDGVVRLSKPYSGYGNVIVIRHYNGLETVYSHNVRNLVKVNQIVKHGDPISLAGRTGRATTEHLHFEVRVRGQAVDPNYFIDVHNHTLKEDDLYITKRGTGVSVSRNVPSKADLAASAQDASIGKSEVTVVLASEIKEQEAKEEAKAAAIAAAAPTIHRVVSGDNLGKIARKYGTSIDKLCQLNGLTRKSILQLGQKIKVK